MPSTSDEDAVTKVIASLIDAWQHHDADAYGAQFTQDATYVTFVGTYYQGRRDIIDSHRALFATFLKDTQLADEILDVRFCGPDTAVITGRGDTYKGGTPKKLTKIQTYILVREQDGQWRIAAFQNTKRKPLMEALSFKVAPALTPSPRHPGNDR